MYPGMIISYKVAPILNVKMHWVTEIKQVVKHKYFVDDKKVPKNQNKCVVLSIHVGNK